MAWRSRSPQFVSRVTEELQQQITEWQSRPLERVYPILFVDGLRLAIRIEKGVLRKCVYRGTFDLRALAATRHMYRGMWMMLVRSALGVTCASATGLREGRICSHSGGPLLQEPQNSGDQSERGRFQGRTPNWSETHHRLWPAGLRQNIPRQATTGDLFQKPF